MRSPVRVVAAKFEDLVSVGLRQLIAQDPKDTWARLGRARVLSEQRRLVPAKEELEAVLRLEPLAP